MNQLYRKLYPFLKAVRGNWRNAIFVRCGSLAIQNSCTGFLLVADSDGHPLLVSAQTMHRFTGDCIDPGECCAILDRHSFEAAFDLYIKWHTSNDALCPLCQLCMEADLFMPEEVKR